MKYYEILDIPPSATDEQIRTTYRILVQLHHPDRLQQMSPVVREYAEEPFSYTEGCRILVCYSESEN